MTTKTHTYREHKIEACQYEKGAHMGRWIVRSYHPTTGLPYSDESSAHYHTLAAAKQAIDEQIKYEAANA